MKEISKKIPKVSREKVVRTTFSLPNSCIEQLDRLQVKFGMKGHILNRSEVVRIGLATLERMKQDELHSAASSVERLKAGRPKLLTNGE